MSIASLSQLSTEEVNLVLNTPALVSLLIGGADNNFDKLLPICDKSVKAGNNEKAIFKKLEDISKGCGRSIWRIFGYV